MVRGGAEGGEAVEMVLASSSGIAVSAARVTVSAQRKAARSR